MENLRELMSCSYKAMIQQNFLGRTRARMFLKHKFFFNSLWFFQFGKSGTISQSFKNQGTFFFKCPQEE